MTKTERIRQLEDEVAGLLVRLATLSERVNALEARPQVVNVHNEHRKPMGHASNVWPAWVRAMLR